MRVTRRLIPNVLSLTRLPLGLVFIASYDVAAPRHFFVAMVAMLLAIATDLTDGPLARRLGVADEVGSLIDGLGDKAFYIAVYLVIAANEPQQSVLLWLLIFREIITYAVRVMDPKAFATM